VAKELGLDTKALFLRREELQRHMSVLRGSSAPAKGGKPWWRSLPILPVAGWLLSQQLSHDEPEQKSHPVLNFLAKNWKWAQPASFLGRLFT
jgi:hypothetical protein